MEKPLREVVGELRALLACPQVGALPWKYGEGRIEGRISKEWPIDNKMLARAAVNALPRLLAAVEPYLAEEDRKHRAEEDRILKEADAIRRKRLRCQW
jgi:hypothetical protein